MQRSFFFPPLSDVRGWDCLLNITYQSNFCLSCLLNIGYKRFYYAWLPQQILLHVPHNWHQFLIVLWLLLFTFIVIMQPTSAITLQNMWYESTSKVSAWVMWLIISCTRKKNMVRPSIRYSWTGCSWWNHFFIAILQKTTNNNWWLQLN